MTADSLAGRLTLHPGRRPAIACVRPMVSEPLMQQLAAGRRASLLPDLIAAVFTLCATAQRATARRAVAAALGLHDDAAAVRHDLRVLALVTAREHLQRIALDLPALVAVPGVAADPGWLRDAPVMALPQRLAGPGEAALHTAAMALPGWLARALFGLPCADWLAGWQADPDGWLLQWVQGRAHPVARWLAAVHETARGFVLPCRPLGLLDEAEDGLREAAARLADTPAYAERPLWHGGPAETGPWTRRGRTVAADTLWRRLGARMADLAFIGLHAAEAPLAAGALAPAPGEGLAWSEMSRGLLLHWVRLEEGPTARDPDTARVAVYRVVAPTEWNFHPDGALAQALAVPGVTPSAARLAAATLDPCLAIDVDAEAGHA